MWWFTSLAVGGVAFLIQQALKKKAQAEYERWNRDYPRTLDRVRQQRQAIAERIRAAHQCFDFHLLYDLHFASAKAANEAYRLLQDAKVAVTEIRKAIDDIKVKMEGIYCQAKAPGLNELDREKLHSRLAELKKFKGALFESVKTPSEQADYFREEVRRLNQDTHDLKHTIRDRCGRQGAEWYNELEARTRARSVRRAS